MSSAWLLQRILPFCVGSLVSFEPTEEELCRIVRELLIRDAIYTTFLTVHILLLFQEHVYISYYEFVLF